jgi:hypothetical protein
MKVNHFNGKQPWLSIAVGIFTEWYVQFQTPKMANHIPLHVVVNSVPIVYLSYIYIDPMVSH